MDAYIISYFGKDPKLQHKRQLVHFQQLCALLKWPGIEDIHVLAQDYNAYMLDSVGNRIPGMLDIEHPRIHYHHYPQMFAGCARNKLLDIFNATDKPWAMFLDNDALPDPRGNGLHCAEIIERNADYLYDADCITVVSPMHESWGAQFESNREKMSKYLHLVKTHWLKTSLFFIKNSRLYNKPVIHFDESLSQIEDHEYVGRLLADGRMIYKAQSVLLYEMSANNSTILEVNNAEESTEARRKLYEPVASTIYDRYKHIGAQLNDGHVTFKYNTLQDYRRPTIQLPVTGSVKTTFNDLFV